MISEYPTLRLALFLGVLGLMFFIETYWPHRSWFDRRSDRVKYSIGLAIINNLTMKLLIAAPFIWWASFVHDNQWGLSKMLGLTGPAEVLATIVLFDFFDALKHKWFHRVPFMWRFHRVHHTDKTLDILTALRYHPGEMVISAVIKAGWILLWGPSILAFTAFEIVLNFASEFHHSNIHFGKWDKYLNKVIVTPKYHAIHHTINRAKGDQNFTTIFSIWDRLLGTYSSPETTEVNLERLNTLQNKHLSLIDTLKSPLISPYDNGEERFNEASFGNQKDFLNSIYESAKVELQLNRALLVDVREDSERRAHGSIEGAKTFPFGQFNEEHISEIKTLGKGKAIYVFCAAGVRSQKVIDRLTANGLKATNLGGFNDCLEGGLKRAEDSIYSTDVQLLQTESAPTIQPSTL